MERINKVALVYENRDICIFTKPAGVPTTNKNDMEISVGTFISKVFELRPELISVDGYRGNEGGLLYRLDNDTSGIVAVAKSSQSFAKYAKKQQEGMLWKKYMAECTGNDFECLKRVTNLPWVNNSFYELFSMKESKMKDWYMIDIPIGFSRKSSKRMVVKGRYKNYRGKLLNRKTYIRIIKKDSNKCVVDVRINKGARHQIRVHLSSIGLPVLLDKIYNRSNNTENSGNLGLCCYGFTTLKED